MELMLLFTRNGLSIIRKGDAEQTMLEGAPKTLPEFIDAVREGDTKYVDCSAAFSIVRRKEENLIEGVEGGGAAIFEDETEGTDIVLTFC